MRIETALLVTTAIVGIASSAFADDSRLMAQNSCITKGDACANYKPSQAVKQPDYPFENPTRLPESDLNKIRNGIVEENLGTMLDPSEIGAVQNRKLDAQGAAAYPGYAGEPLPAARRRDIKIRKGPAQGPEELWLAQNVISPISFEDHYGNAWPIASIGYDPRIYSVNGQGCGQNTAPTLVSEQRPTFITITPCKFWTWGSLTVQLEDVNVPVVFIAGSGKLLSKKHVDVPVIVQVEGLSPTGKKPVARGTSPKPRADTGPSSIYQSFLSGTPPREAVMIGTSDQNTSAWLFQGSMFLAAPYEVITPTTYDAVASGYNKTLFRFNRAISRVQAASADGTERVITIGN